MTIAQKLGVSAFFATFFLLAFVPAMSSAQEDSLSATIRAAITADAEYENLSQEQIDAMVAALAREAQAEGVTAGDIAWRPQETTFAGDSNEMTECNFLCAFNQIFGFSGKNLIPWFLLISSMGLIFVIGTMIEVHKHHQMARTMPPPSSPFPIPPQGNPPMGGPVPPPSF